MIKISPSILAADPLCLGQVARLVRNAGCDELHFDVMDGHFVPNLTFGPHILKAMKRETDICYDVHLMLSKPMVMVDRFMDAGADILTVHVEAEGFEACLERISERGVKVGASLKPATPVAALKAYLHRLYRVLLMTVEPGFGGQKLMAEVLHKARELRALGFAGEIEADGGITVENAPLLAKAGVDVLVMGTAFFSATSPESVAKLVHEL
ncbi:MAG: ribulose-phosphate 3-epimerase [Clostridia bacterium]